MNRNIMLISVFAGLGLAVVGAMGFAVVFYYMSQGAIDGPGKAPPRNTPPPFSQAQMQDLHDNPDKAAKEIPKIIECFENGDAELRELAAETLRHVGKPAVEPLRTNLTHDNEEVRFYCVQALAHLKTDASPAVSELVKCVNDVNPRVRYKAVYTLGQTGVKSDAVFRSLLGALDDLDPRVPEEAIKALDEIGAPPKESLPRIAKVATNGATPQIRQTARKLLGKLGEPAVPTFKELLLNEQQPGEMVELIKAVALLGPDAKSLLPELETVMLSVDWFDVQPEVLILFKKCGPEGADALTRVINKLNVPDEAKYSERNPELLKALGEMGSEAKTAVPTLIVLLKKRQSHIFQVLETLGDIGPAAKDAIPEVEALLKDTEAFLKVAKDPQARKTQASLTKACQTSLRRMAKIDMK